MSEPHPDPTSPFSDILTLSSSSHNITTSSDDVTPRKRPPKLSDTRLRTTRISFPEVTDNLSNIVESLRLKWALLARQYSSRDPTIDSSFPKDLSVDTSDALISDLSSEDLTHEQDPGSLQALEFRGCAREILDELEALISATNPMGAFPTEDESVTSQGMAELGEEGMQSLIEYYYQQQVSSAGYALECIASCTVDAVLTKSLAFLALEDYREQDQCHLRSIMDTIDTTFPKGRVESGELRHLTSSMVETHVRGRLDYFQKKVDKFHANNRILDWIKGTGASDAGEPTEMSLISWMIAVPSSSSEDEGDSHPSASRIRSCELNESQGLSDIFEPRQSISDITFSFSRRTSSDASMVMQCEPSLFNRKLSDSSQLSSSCPSTDLPVSSIETPGSLDRVTRDNKQKVTQEYLQEQQCYSSQQNGNVIEEARDSVVTVASGIESKPIASNAEEHVHITIGDTLLPQTREGVKMRQIKGRGRLLKQYSSTQLYDDSNIESSSKQMISDQLKTDRPHTLPPVVYEGSQEEQPSPTTPTTPTSPTSSTSPGEDKPALPAQRRGSRGLLKPSRSFEEGSRSGKCVEFTDTTEYVMPPVQEMENIGPEEQASPQEGHKSSMASQSRLLRRKPLLSSFSFDVGHGIPDLGTDSVTPSLSRNAPEADSLEQFEKFEQEWRTFQVTFEADLFSSRHRLRQSNINLNRKLERMHEYASALDECISLLARSTSQEISRELEETFRINLNALNTSLQDVVATAQMVGHLSQEHKDNDNFRLCFSYVDKLKSRSRDATRSDFRMTLPRQESTVSNSSEPAFISEDMVQLAIERFISQPAQERQWPSFRKERSQFTAQQSQVEKELKLVIKNYDSLFENRKEELNWIKFSVKLMLLVLLLILLLYLTSESIELSLHTLLRNLGLR